MWEFIQNNPKIGSLSLASIFTTIGFFGKTLIDFYIEGIKLKEERKSVFWKEKINASKKASEFYYEQINLFELMILNMKTQSENNKAHFYLKDSMNKLNEKHSNPDNFEHHHVNIFYNFNYKELINKGKKLTFEIGDVYIQMKLNEKNNGKNNTVVYESYKKVIETAEEINMIYRANLEIIRQDIAGFVK